MFEKLFRKKKEPATAPDVSRVFEIPEDIRKRIAGHAGHNAKTIFADYIKTVSRVHLLSVGDNPWFTEHKEHDWLIEAYNDEEWKRDWPTSKYQYEDMIPDIVMDTIPIQGLDKKKPINLGQLVKQVEGIQKKLDRVLKIIENTEVTMSAKTALSM